MPDLVRVLVIDDCEDDRLLYSRVLHKSQDTRYELSEVDDGEAGLARIPADRPDCILLDYSLPGRNGVEVLKRIHAAHPFVPVVMLTGQGNETVAVAAMREGARNYISKSTITPESLQNAVRGAIAHCAMEKRIHEQRASLDIFARALAHDLKEPIRTIKSFLALLAAGECFSEEGRGHLEFLESAADRMVRLVDAVHLYTRLESATGGVDKEPCDLAAILDDVRDNIGELIRERGAVVAGGQLGTVPANRVQLTQVLQNLICNAIRHTAQTPVVRVESGETASEVEVRVSDNGPGVAEADRERIFEPFKRLTRQKDQGMGLGLAICKRIVEGHGGRIRCEAGAEGGAAFVFALPQAGDAKAQGPDARQGGARVGGGAGASSSLANVLLVDDNEADIELARITLFRRAGLSCNLLVAHDAQEALSIIKAPPAGAAVDLVLLDINMSGMDGLELLGRLRDEGVLSRLAVIMCTTSTYDKDIERAGALGAKAYLTKPAEMTKLAAAVGNIASLRLKRQGDVFELSRVA